MTSGEVPALKCPRASGLSTAERSMTVTGSPPSSSALLMDPRRDVLATKAGGNFERAVALRDKNVDLHPARKDRFGLLAEYVDLDVRRDEDDSIHLSEKGVGFQSAP